MKDLENNIKLNYLYRDSGNYKIYGTEIFSNPEHIKVEEIERKVRDALIDSEFFDPRKWGLKPLSFQEWNDDLDHLWNEFESINLTAETPTVDKTITEFLDKIVRDR
jgi:hypothetical protein